MFRSERVLRIICFEPVFLAFNPGGLSAKPYRTRVFFLHIFLPAHKKLIVLGHFSFQFELWFFLIWSWSIPVGASEIRCSTRVFAASKTAATDHSRHESAKCEQDSKSGSRASGSWVRIPPYPPHRRSKVRFAPAFLCPNFINLRFRRLSICFQNSRPPEEAFPAPLPAPRIFGIVVEMGITVDEGSTGGYVAFQLRS